MKGKEFIVSKIHLPEDTESLKKSLIYISCIFVVLGLLILSCQSIGNAIRLNKSKIHYEYDNQTGINFSNIAIPLPFEPYYLVAGGDVMLSRNIGYFAKNEGYDRIFKIGNYNPLSEFKKCKSNNCQLFLNLEGLFCEPDHDIQLGGFDFRANPKNIETLNQYRQDKTLLLALPNNHFINGGYQGLTITKELLDQNGIGFVGAGLTEEESRDFKSWTGNGIKFCLGAYSYDGAKAKVRGGVVVWNDLSEEKIKEDLTKMDKSRCNIKIISLHRGAEYRFSPNSTQRKLAHSLVDAGADLILGGHSHIPGEFEKYNGKYIFYSLGNFIFDQGRGKRATGTEFNYFFDEDLHRKNVPTYISMLIGFKFKKNLMGDIDISLDQVEFSSTTDGIFKPVGSGTRNNLLDIINLTEEKF